MRERGLHFENWAVRAIMARVKVQDRRAVKVPPGAYPVTTAQLHREVTEVVPSLLNHDGDLWDFRRDLNSPIAIRCPFGKVGDRIFVRERWRAVERAVDGLDGILYDADKEFLPIAPTREAADRWVEAYDNGKHRENWRSSMHLPRWAVRTVCELTEIRVQRIQKISIADVFAEGVRGYARTFLHSDIEQYIDDGDEQEICRAYEYQWNSLHRRDHTDDNNHRNAFAMFNNPLVWCLTWKVVERQVIATVTRGESRG